MHAPPDLSGMTKQWLPPVSRGQQDSVQGAEPYHGQDKVKASTLQPQDVSLMLGSAGVVSTSKCYLVPFLGCVPLFVLTDLGAPPQGGCRAPRVLVLRALLSLPVQQSKPWCAYAAAHLPNLLVNAQGAFLNVLHVGHNRFIN